ncbi:DinB family protein [Puerhibacterium puerhi]|uniref:DinB family protein n=1 Tax=Puerhibacterium puerhi TaxID=2692623 RepID=UPI00135BFBD7|nr:DinB family protein [Puerhibacterium puerhi]
MAVSDVEPQVDSADPGVQLVAYLDYYRGVVERKLRGLTDDRLRRTALPSGWTPLEMLAHLVHMERRWFVWGFLAEPVPDPWGDHADGVDGGRWHVPDDVRLDDLLGRLRAGGERTRAILTSTPLDARGRVGGRFTAEPTPTLAWIGFHVLQEYARHAGHLDVARELIDGATGE